MLDLHHETPRRPIITFSESDNRSWELLAELIGSVRGKSATFARAMKISVSLVHKWIEPPASAESPYGSGAINPLDRIAQICAVLTSDGQQERAVETVRWLAARVGCRVERIRPASGEIETVILETLTLAANSGDVVSAVRAALAEQRIDARAARAIFARLDALHEETEAVRRCIELHVADSSAGRKTRRANG